jgi:diaminohydroxyphosphoribosylaminopyrimidine deaminase/5-amino-6-(5-phosphoribosylamino)uracil reductase
MSASFDIDMMARAIRLAQRGIYSSRPNPAVGCVITRDGEIIGEGYTQPAGQNHAEIEALNNCQNPFGATAYVTLEPCSHQGKTGPCANALVAAGIAKIFISMRDPNPEVAGEGIDKLKAARIEVEEGLLAAQAETINPGFYQRMRTGRPRVRIKLASSLDGRTAMASGESQWITGPAARADVQKLRGRSDAIITGVETVLHDNPAMTVRDDSLDIQHQPLRVILDSSLRTPADAKILSEAGSSLIVYADQNADTSRYAHTNTECLHLPGPDNRVDLAQLLTELGWRQVNDILVECGPRLAGAFVGAGLVDKLIVYMAATLLGSNARPLLELPIDVMDDQHRLTIADMRQVGEDWRVTCLPAS